jgi:hypothetical protein
MNAGSAKIRAVSLRSLAEEIVELAIEKRDSQLANVLAPASNALQNKDNRRQGMLRPCSKQSLDKDQQSVRGAEVLVESAR